jgi:drug/metabolite transporter (DMT)-like permease
MQSHSTQKDILRADLLLLTTAFLWGSTFTAQRMAMEDVGPLLYTGTRFLVGFVFLLPIVWRHKRRTNTLPGEGRRGPSFFLRGALYAGLALFGGISLQQAGLVYTTAGKAGFITSLYVVIVPVIGIFLGQSSKVNDWIGAVTACIGLYMLSVGIGFEINTGDIFVCIGAFSWAAHVHVLSRWSPRLDSLMLAAGQYLVTAVLGMTAAFLFEPVSTAGIISAAGPILFGGIVSVGIAYTLQVAAQRHAPPTHAAIILSLEAVFAVLVGWLILSETLSNRELTGCALLLAGCLATQIRFCLPWQAPSPSK